MTGPEVALERYAASLRARLRYAQSTGDPAQIKEAVRALRHMPILPSERRADQLRGVQQLMREAVPNPGGRLG